MERKSEDCLLDELVAATLARPILATMRGEEI